MLLQRIDLRQPAFLLSCHGFIKTGQVLPGGMFHTALEFGRMPTVLTEDFRGFIKSLQYNDI